MRGGGNTDGSCCVQLSAHSPTISLSSHLELLVQFAKFPHPSLPAAPWACNLSPGLLWSDTCLLAQVSAPLLRYACVTSPSSLLPQHGPEQSMVDSWATLCELFMILPPACISYSLTMHFSLCHLECPAAIQLLYHHLPIDKSLDLSFTPFK